MGLLLGHKGRNLIGFQTSNQCGFFCLRSLQAFRERCISNVRVSGALQLHGAARSGAFEAYKLSGSGAFPMFGGGLRELRNCVGREQVGPSEHQYNIYAI